MRSAPERSSPEGSRHLAIAQLGLSPRSSPERRTDTRAELAFLRHVSPAQVLVLKNSEFDLMTRSAFIARSTADRTHPQSVEMPEGLGNL